MNHLLSESAISAQYVIISSIASRLHSVPMAIASQKTAVEGGDFNEVKNIY